MTDQSNLVEPEGVNAPGGSSSGGSGGSDGTDGAEPGDARSGGSPEHAGDDEANEMHPSPLGGSPWQDPDAPDGAPSADR
jgi:hypothetical protein